MKIDFNFLWSTLFLALKGIPVALGITLFSVLFGLILGFICFMIKRARLPFFARLISVFVSFLRGTPLIVQLFMAFAILPLLVQNFFHYFEIRVNIYDLNPVYYALFVFSFYAMAVYSEMWKSAFSAVGSQQLDAANSVGLNHFQAYKDRKSVV